MERSAGTPTALQTGATIYFADYEAPFMFLSLLLGIYVAGVVSMLAGILCAPQGYEDADGFHAMLRLRPVRHASKLAQSRYHFRLAR